MISSYISLKINDWCFSLGTLLHLALRGWLAAGYLIFAKARRIMVLSLDIHFFVELVVKGILDTHDMIFCGRNNRKMVLGNIKGSFVNSERLSIFSCLAFSVWC